MPWAPDHLRMMWEDRLCTQWAGIWQRQVRPYSRLSDQCWAPTMEHWRRGTNVTAVSTALTEALGGPIPTFLRAHFPSDNGCSSLLHANELIHVSFHLRVQLITSTQKVLPHSLLHSMHSKAHILLKLSYSVHGTFSPDGVCKAL